MKKRPYIKPAVKRSINLHGFNKSFWLGLVELNQAIRQWSRKSV